MTTRILALLTLAILSPLGWSRTITLTAEDSDQMAIISALAPRLSWAGVAHGPYVYDSGPQAYLLPKKAILIRFPLDKIPKDQRILKAELVIQPTYVAGAAKIQVRRLLADWGTGVCHDFARTWPKKVEWSQPGGRGALTDRANKDSALIPIHLRGEHTAEVTEDVELWYTGGAPNRGWIMNLENDLGAVYLGSPHNPSQGTGKTWKLIITYEPQ